jgi:glycosyltransferase involved in cell wall biosynthesis
MRIAFIGARGVVGKYSGIETYYEEVGSRLVQLGHDVTVYCRSYFTPPVASYRGMRVRRFPTVRSKHLETIVHSALCTVDALFRRYDVVQFHALGSSPLAVLPRLTGKRTVVSVRGLDGEREKWSAFAKSYLRACEWASAHCPSITSVVSRELLDYYVRRYQTKATYIPNGVTLKPAIRPLEITQFGLGRRNYILYVGRLTPEKGCHQLIEAFRGVDTEFKLVFVGGSTYASSYVEALKRYESERILFLGFQTGEILEELFSNAYLYVLPSTIEGLSISLLEAMAYANCVVTSDIPENLELVKGRGFTFKTNNTSDLRQTLAYLVHHPELVEASGTASRKLIEAEYTWDMIAKRTEGLFKDLLSGTQDGVSSSITSQSN